MKNRDEIRRQNLKTLGDDMGGMGVLAEAIEVSRSQLSIWANGTKDSKSGKPRKIKDESLRKAEKKLAEINPKITQGWFDEDHTEKSKSEMVVLQSRAIPINGLDELLLVDKSVSENAFAIHIQEDSMRPEFDLGDTVIIDPAVKPRPGDCVVARTGEETEFRRYRQPEVGVDELVPLNGNYPVIRSDKTPFEIVGTAVEHRKYRKK